MRERPIVLAALGAAVAWWLAPPRFRGLGMVMSGVAGYGLGLQLSASSGAPSSAVQAAAPERSTPTELVDTRQPPPPAPLEPRADPTDWTWSWADQGIADTGGGL